jgi:hypothetical protein
MSADLRDALKQLIAEPAVFVNYLMPVPKDDKMRAMLERTPPQDTFHRWSYYLEVNYDRLRMITEGLYPERPDLDMMIALWEFAEGTPEEVKAKFNAFTDLHQSETPSSLKSIEFGQWTILADVAGNRKDINILNKRTEILEKIIDRHTADKRHGEPLMKNRVYHKKAEDVRNHGPDPAGLSSYKSINSTSATPGVTPEQLGYLERAKGNIKNAREMEYYDEKIRDLKVLDNLKATRPLTHAEQQEYEATQRDIERAKEMMLVPEDGIQVDVFTHDAREGTMSKTHFYTASSEALEQKATDLKRASSLLESSAAQSAQLSLDAPTPNTANPAQ